MSLTDRVAACLAKENEIAVFFYLKIKQLTIYSFPDLRSRIFVETPPNKRIWLFFDIQRSWCSFTRKLRTTKIYP